MCLQSTISVCGEAVWIGLWCAMSLSVRIYRKEHRTGNLQLGDSPFIGLCSHQSHYVARSL